jgi:hypothetical protein
VGDSIKLTVNRNEQIMDLTATLQARPQANPQDQQQQQDEEQPGLSIIPKLSRTPGHRHHRHQFLQSLLP